MKTISKENLTKSEFLIYCILKKEGQLTKKQIVDKLGISKGTVINTMKKFKKYGIIIVYPNLRDMRTYYICLTEKEMKKS